jgi:hypothetical protein
MKISDEDIDNASRILGLIVMICLGVGAVTITTVFVTLVFS